MFPQGHWVWPGPGWSAAATVQRGIGECAGQRCSAADLNSRQQQRIRPADGRHCDDRMAKRNIQMYPGLNQGEFPSMLDSRLYPSLMAPPPPAEHGGAPKICGVCSDRAKSLHFGGMACDSCKAFFRRSVQNEAYKHFRCSYDGHCHITITSRKCCQFCRFNKCTEIGMEKSWVMTEEERMQQLKIRQEKKRQKQEEEERRRLSQEHRIQPHEPQMHERHLYLSDEDWAEIDLLFSTFYRMYEKHPMLPDAPNHPEEAGNRMITIFVNGISRIVGFVSELPRFRQLTAADRKVLLQNGLLAIVILRGTMVYEGGSKFALRQSPGESKPARVDLEEIRAMLTPDLYESHGKFYMSIKEMGLDEKTLMLLQMIVLYSHDRMGLAEPEKISSYQEHYTALIRRYMRWRYGEENTRLLFPKMLHSLADLRALTEAHNMTSITLPAPDINKVTTKIKEMGLNPYPNCPEMTTPAYPIPQRHRSEMGDRSVSAPARDDRPLTGRSASLPGYPSGFTPPQPGPPPGPGYQQQFGAAGGYTEPYGAACSFGPRDLSQQQWAPGYHEAAALPAWPEEQRGGRQPTFPSQQDYQDLSSFLGLEKGGHEEKRLKTEPPSPLGSPRLSRAIQTNSYPAVTSPQQQQHQQQQQQQQQQQPQQQLASAGPFSPFCSQHSGYERPRPSPYTDAPGYHGNYDSPR